MTDKTILQRLTDRTGVPADSGGSEPDLTDDFNTFGWLRGIRDSARMLELRKKNGNIVAIGYGWLERAEFNPSEGISLTCLGRTIRIRGRNLNSEIRPGVRLFAGIVRHRVPWLRESDEPDVMEAGPEAPVIDGIEC